MLAATVLGVLIIPALYVLIEKLSGRGKAAPPQPAEPGP
jgi:hypothetical protein